jgi:Cdc6-like AAA superfamily ATPase
MTDSYILFEEARKQGSNPFRLKPIVSADEVWGDVISDLPDLNQHVDKKIYQAISEVRQKYSDKIGIAVKGDRGTGKSHVIHRIWKTIESDGGAVFAYIPPFANPNRIDSHVRLYLAQSFSHTDVRKVTQWQRLAAAMISTLNKTEFAEQYQPYLERCEQPDELRKYILEIHKDTVIDFFEELVEAILENQTTLDFDFLKALLLLLLKNNKMSQIGKNWIQGLEHPDTKKVGLPELSAEEQEANSIWFMQQICKVAEVASLPVIICFDQLDSARSSVESGDSPAETVARCIDKIYFQCSNVIILCCVISDTWREIEQMGSGIPDRVGQWSVTTKPPTAEQMVELVKLRLTWFHKSKNLNIDVYPPLFPFDENEIKGIANKAAGVRSLMTWCADKFESVVIDGGSGKEKTKQEKFRDNYNELLNRVSIPQNDDDQLAAIMACAMQMIPDGGTENVVITDVTTFNTPYHDLHFTISGYDSLQNKEVKIGVRVCETPTAKTFNAVMKRLLNYNNHKLTRGCLVRSTTVPKSWKVGNTLKDQLEQAQGGEVVTLKKEELKPLIAIKIIYDEATNYGFSNQEVIDFIKELRLAADNPLICEILSAPV